MTLQELLRKPVRLVVTNDVQQDAVQLNATVVSLIHRTTSLIATDSLNFLIAIVNENFKLRAVVTNREANQLLDILIAEVSKADFKADRLISDLNLEVMMPPKFSVNRDTDSIQKAYEMLQSGATDIIVAIDSLGNYVGKIRRNDFSETLKSLLS
jgi:CBS-domain-containing membrane protein